MLNMFRDNMPLQSQCVPETASFKIAAENRYNRSLKADMKKAVDLLFQFRADLEELHPDCGQIIDRLLSCGSYPR